MQIKTKKTHQCGAYLYERGASFITRITHNGMSYVGYIPYMTDMPGAREEAYEFARSIRNRILCHIDALCRGEEQKLPPAIEYATIKTYATKQVH